VPCSILLIAFDDCVIVGQLWYRRRIVSIDALKAGLVTLHTYYIAGLCYTAKKAIKRPAYKLRSFAPLQ
jgi:hypothetical protein